MLVIVPTRGRPENVARQQDAVEQTCTHADFLYAVDDDDPKAMEYLRLAEERSLNVAVGPRMRLGPTLSFHAVREAANYSVIGFMGDDHLPRTTGWACRILNRYGRDVPCVFYPNDLLQGENLATAVFMTGRMITAMGYMVPPGLIHLYADNAWMELGRGLGMLFYLPDVVIEHMHPAAGKAELDVGYREANAPEIDSADRAAFFRWRDGGERDSALQRIREEYTHDKNETAAEALRRS
jgi:hypothetical protein